MCLIKIDKYKLLFLVVTISAVIECRSTIVNKMRTLLWHKSIVAYISFFLIQVSIVKAKIIVVNTWNFTNANRIARVALDQGKSALDSVELGCSQCEVDRCDGTVGWGGSPSETGETTLDAMIMDGETYDVGAVAGLRNITNAIGVARKVLEHTDHTLLVGDMATEFALKFGFKAQDLTSKESINIHTDWIKNNCQPNFWKNVEPDPKTSCGPYTPLQSLSIFSIKDLSKASESNHDTIGMVSIDKHGRIASGTSTNGLRNKIHGRVGDSPIVGSGSYAAKDVGAAAATGDGDIIMRHLVSYQAVENLRQGMTPKEAALDVMKRLESNTFDRKSKAAVIVVSKDRAYGAACVGYQYFPFVVGLNHKQFTAKVKCIDNNSS